ncbi:2OG-Fe(II) oxygenase [Stenotrophomonas sp. RS-48]|uniref:2OG-Fe(II) oxygenase n=1 Tax=Stenotrophomonas sp. RS-48 TaxID=3043300 RepID=UPI0024B5532C|nr:2OG-Fe(II) oxygenase [Stenotrophomonas sp. RS-48]MDI9248322.1 2OG-Fe(II) oxygenase [Stenotrophomonas sp. RS-48]
MNAINLEPSSILNGVDWGRVADELRERGNSCLPRLLSPEQCQAIAGSYNNDLLYRTRIVMAKHGFGKGEYKYFAYPLPTAIEDLRHALYSKLVPIANQWVEQLKIGTRYPDDLGSFLARCHDVGQLRPTPLLLEYSSGDYNCLHQDLYGEHVFPLQVAILLSAPEQDFHGGQFVMAMKSGSSSFADVVDLQQGDAVVFAVNYRPVVGKRGTSIKGQARHGVSRIRAGKRHTLGLIFHDSK